MRADPPKLAIACATLALGFSLALAACKSKPDDENSGATTPSAPQGSPAPPAQESPAPPAGETVKAASPVVERPAPSIQPGIADPAASITAPAPVEKGQFIAPLRDAYERIDPSKDGWETEAFSAAAKKQLHHLEELLSAGDPLNPESLQGLVSETVTTTPLRPKASSSVYSDGRLVVTRALPPPACTTSGAAALVESLNQFLSAGTSLQPHLKIFRVARRSESSANTTVLVDIAANSPTTRRQINATWSCDWLTSPDALPFLDSIQVTKYEEITQENNPAPLFSDATAAVLGQNPSYREQFLTPTDYWRARLPRELGLDAVANHGLALGDINGDDLDDLYVCQQGGLPNRMFIQNPDGTLRDVTESSGTGWLDYCAGALLVDLDNDGDRDLIVSQDFRMLVMSNDGKGVFTLEFGTTTKAQSFSLAAADYDHDGLVDFYICGYNPSNAEMRGGAMGEPLPFHDANNGGPNMLWHNEGEFKFTDVTSRTGLDQNNTRFTFAAAWEDYDNDGDQDLYIANDYGRNCLYRNDGGKFTDVAPDLQVEDTSSGMSVSWSDFNRDGYMDLYTSNMFSSAGNRITYQRQFKEGVAEEIRKQFQHIALGNSLFQAAPGAAFKDVGVEAAVTMGRWAWGSRFVDFNNDGWDDILVANGFITTADSGDL